MIETKAELEQARALLEERTPGELAAFILSLVHASNGIGAYVQAFSFATQPESAARVIESEIALLARGEREYDYRHRQSFDMSARVERALAAIETVILPRDRALGARLLGRFIASGEEILGNCGEDDDAHQIFRRAQKILETTGGSIQAP